MKFPPVLIITLQRINQYNQTKNTALVHIDNVIDIKSFENKVLGSGLLSSRLYEIVAIINHEGQIDNGHYYNFIKIKGVWYHFSDSEVKKCDNYIEESANAYCLFYVKKS